jgi:ABC-2 type transport system ATP-binding protein
VNESLISLDSLHHAYGSQVALTDISAEIPAGQIGLVGANGAGKSTLIQNLLGILTPTQGSASLFGLPVRENLLAVRRRVGYMSERTALPLDQTAADFLIYAAQLAGLPSKDARQRASEILTLTGLHEERFRHIREFSTGMKQRVMIAQAIVHDPDLVFLDEPTAGLDPEGRDEMLDLIARLGSFGINTVVSSHVLTDIEAVCNWVIMLDGGKLLRNSALETLVDSAVIELEVFGDPADVTLELTSRGARVTLLGSVLEIRIDGEDPHGVVMDALASAGVGVRSLRSKRTSLEDVFLAEGESA